MYTQKGNILVSLIIQKLVNKGYVFNEVPNTNKAIEVIDNQGNYNVLFDIDFKEWLQNKAEEV